MKMNVSKNLLSNILAAKVLLRVLQAKGRKRKGLDEAIENARKSLSGDLLVEFNSLVELISFSYRYDAIRLKAIHNQRNSLPERKKARVLSFIENNPDHPLVKELA